MLIKSKATRIIMVEISKAKLSPERYEFASVEESFPLRFPMNRE